jgi:quinolinate synthase
MAMNGLAGVVDCLESGRGEVTVPEPTRAQALGCIERMLDFVAKNPQAIVTPRGGFVPDTGAA